MNIEEINNIITKYDNLISLIKKTVKSMENIDNYYDTDNYIQTIDFEKNKVVITCNDNRCGYIEHYYIEFPIYFLTLNDDELKKAVESEKEIRIEKEKKEKEEKILKEKKKMEEKELEDYKRLKAKFKNY